MPKSEAFQRGYESALTLWNGNSSTLSTAPFEPLNPFPVGSEEEEGFEAAVYDLTQK